jgi:hypothetical protein
MTAEPPLQIENREELVYLLGEACELEHGLMCEYLYAQFSLKRATGESLTPEQLARVQAWETTLIDIIKQEMLHLALATNILTAVGAAPHFERPNLPILSRWYPPSVQGWRLDNDWPRSIRSLFVSRRSANLSRRGGSGLVAVGIAPGSWCGFRSGSGLAEEPVLGV